MPGQNVFPQINPRYQGYSPLYNEDGRLLASVGVTRTTIMTPFLIHHAPDYLCYSIFNICCCLLLGIVALIYSMKGMPFSVYGNAAVPPVAQMTDGAGGAIFNGPHAADPSWNSLIKMVSNSTENNCPQTVWTGTWAPHMNGVHMNQLG